MSRRLSEILCFYFAGCADCITSSFSRFCFTGDKSKWIIFDKIQVQGIFIASERWAYKSSESQAASQRKIASLPTKGFQPQLELTAEDDRLYAGGQIIQYTKLLENHKGANVFIRTNGRLKVVLNQIIFFSIHR